MIVSPIVVRRIYKHMTPGQREMFASGRMSDDGKNAMVEQIMREIYPEAA